MIIASFVFVENLLILVDLKKDDYKIMKTRTLLSEYFRNHCITVEFGGEEVFFLGRAIWSHLTYMMAQSNNS